jgi:DNA-binding IclR family transcriptional regulator
VPGAAQPIPAGGIHMLNDREKILTALREKPLKIFEVMKRANLPNQEACQALLLKMRDEGSVKFDIHKGQWHIG